MTWRCIQRDALRPSFMEGDHRPLGEEGQKRLGIGEAARGPDETDEAIPERRAELQADADVDAHDLGGLQRSRAAAGST